MKVILLRDMPGVGKKGEVKEVTSGHARNFLLPRKLAEPATDTALRVLGERQERALREKAELHRQQQAAAEKMKSATLRFKTKVGEKGKAFGSITAVKIRDALKKEGIAVEKEWIMLEEGIKTTGEHRIPVKFPQGPEGTINIVIEAE